jgi:hypothetical protein
MFWYLIFAHLMADYPLQPTWMVLKKTNPSVLFLHTAIHFGAMLAVVGAVRQAIWPYLVVLAVIHFGIDLGKNWVNERRPGWVVLPYIVDQIFHYISIWFVSVWIVRQAGALPLPITTDWLIYANTYLFVTYVWFISERILAYTDSTYRKEVVEQLWTRMFARAAFLSGFLFFWRWFLPAAFRPTVAFPVPYFSGRYGTRALVTDLGVALVGMVFILWAI